MKLTVPGATIHYEVRGAGPVLLIGQSGEGDADRGVDLVEQLVDDYTVVTYDRRGLSRSTIDDPTRPLRMADHAADVHHLLAAVTDEPALMLGCSIGAVIGLHVVDSHPGQVRTLVAHEPVAPWLLPTAERAGHIAELRHVQETYRTEGLSAALSDVVRTLGITTEGAEPDLTPQPMTPQRIANFDTFIINEFTAVIEDEPVDIGTDTRVIAAVGAATQAAVFDVRCAWSLARLLGTEPVEFPGGHNGDLSHPRAYAARLHAVVTPRSDGGPASASSSA